MKILTRVVGALATLTACSGPIPVNLAVSDLGGSDSATRSGRALAVSEGGRIVGNYGPGSQAAEFHEDGTVTRLPAPPGYDRCWAKAITDDGIIAGTCTHDDESTLPRAEAVYWDVARVVHRFLESTPEVSNSVTDMNANGVILGSTSTGDLFTDKAWTYDVRSGTLTQLPGLPNAALMFNSINDLGDIVGTSIPGSNASFDRRPFKLSGSPPAITMLTTPLGCIAVASALNNRGVIVGAACVRAVIWSSASAPPEYLPQPPPPAGYQLGGAADIRDVSDNGVIVGTAGYASFGSDVGTIKGIAWTPERSIVDLDRMYPSAVNNAGLVVGTRGARPATAKW